jgi:hypothetical protein
MNTTNNTGSYATQNGRPRGIPNLFLTSKAKKARLEYFIPVAINQKYCTPLVLIYTALTSPKS